MNDTQKFNYKCVFIIYEVSLDYMDIHKSFYKI